MLAQQTALAAEITAAPVNVGWEIAQALGLFANICCLLLCLLTIRPRRPSMPGTAPLRVHALVGWIALAAVLVHAVLLIIADPHVLDHLRPTSPAYEWAGMIALLTLLALTAPSTATGRRSLWSRHRSFQLFHVASACILIVTTAAHVVTTDRFVHGNAGRIAYLAISLLALAMLLRKRARSRDLQPRLALPTATVFGRHAAVVTTVIATSSIALLFLTNKTVGLSLREQVAVRLTPQRVDFPHHKHRDVTCVHCHHNFTDSTGTGSCIGCHRSGSAGIKVGAEARFHDFCLGCHREPIAPLVKHGPVTGCATCHLPLETAVRATASLGALRPSLF